VTDVAVETNWEHRLEFAFFPLSLFFVYLEVSYALIWIWIGIWIGLAAFIYMNERVVL
jgi:hypothetical protein